MPESKSSINYSRHVNLEEPSQSVNSMTSSFYDRYNNWFARPVREAVYIRAYIVSPSTGTGWSIATHLGHIVNEHITWLTSLFVTMHVNKHTDPLVNIFYEEC